MLIFPAIDLRGGKVVRLRLGDFAQETVYSGDPVEVARAFVAEGAQWVHIVDLDGAKIGAPVQLDVVRAICERVAVPVQVGGGIRDIASLKLVLAAGARRVVIGSALIKDPSFAKEAFAVYEDQIVAGIDAREGLVAVSGWLEGSQVLATELARQLEDNGCKRIVFTDIGRDGTLEGPNLDAMQEMLDAVRVPIIASGGVSSSADILALSSLKPKPEGVIVGKAIYEGRVRIAEHRGT